MMQLEGTDQVVYQELEEGVQDPEGAWGWISKKRDDLQSLRGALTIRDFLRLLYKL